MRPIALGERAVKNLFRFCAYPVIVTMLSTSSSVAKNVVEAIDATGAAQAGSPLQAPAGQGSASQQVIIVCH